MPANLHEILSTHARTRMQQRGVPAGAIEHVLSYGRERHDRRGGVVVALDKGARRRLKQSGTASGSEIDRIRSVYVVLSATDGTVVTVGHRYRRLP